MTSIKNLTPHPFVLFSKEDNILLTIPPTGEMARVAETNESDGFVVIGGVEVPVFRKEFTGDVVGLPAEPEEGVTFIVPLLTAIAAKAAGRSTEDLLVPGAPHRNAQGTVDGAYSLARLV